MSDLNRCEFIGRLGQDPESKYLPDGTALVNFSIACGEKYKDKSGQKIEKTEWIRCSAFGKLAEIITQYLKKGSQVYVAGKYETKTWDKDGVKQYSTGIRVTTMQMLGGKQNPSEQQPQPQAAQKTQEELDIPF